MALLENEFDATEVEPAEAFEIIPPGWYVGQITQSEMKTTAAGTGQYLQATISILEGEHRNRIVFERLNLDNPNQVAVDIARRTLSAICAAVGVTRVRDSDQLHNIPFEFKVGVRPARGEYAASNEVKGYRAHKASQNARASQPWNQAKEQQPAPPAHTEPPAQPAPPTQNEQPAPPAHSNAAPWE